MTPDLLNELLSKRVLGIDQALIEISDGQDRKDTAKTIRAHLIDLLALLHRNPGLDAAVDDLHRSVQALITAGAGVEDRQMRLLGEAYARFRDRLEAARVEFMTKKSGEGPVVRLKQA